MERILEILENAKLLYMAVQRADSPTTPFADFVAEEGFSMDELEKLAESVELE